MKRLALARCAFAVLFASAFTLLADPALAQAAASPPKIDAADTAWMISATGLVLMMSLPGLALFYAGLVRVKNSLSVIVRLVVPNCLPKT